MRGADPDGMLDAAHASGIATLALFAWACGRGADEAVPAHPLRTSTIDVDGVRIHLLEQGSSSAPCVLLLHGQAFRAATWQELGTLAFLAEHGWRAVAVDLPGFGESRSSPAPPAEFLEGLFVALALERAVVVSPSMSGRFSLPVLAEHASRFAGFVPIAPVGIDAFAGPQDGASVPTLVLWGGADVVIPVAKAEDLAARIPDARISVIEGASHPCYIDAPARFHADVLAFLESLGPR
jgi:pimeloyl-ACP methyl ester carboxylesterase